MTAPRLAWNLYGLALVLALTGPVLLADASRFPKNGVGWIRVQ